MHLSLYVLSFESQFECVDFALESLIKLFNSSFKVAHCLEEGGSSSTIGHLNMLYGAHIRKIMKSKFGQPCKDHKCCLRVKFVPPKDHPQRCDNVSLQI
jgi:hypothetical protein